MINSKEAPAGLYTKLKKCPHVSCAGGGLVAKVAMREPRGPRFKSLGLQPRLALPSGVSG